MHLTATLVVFALEPLMPGGKAVLRRLCYILKLVSSGAQGLAEAFQPTAFCLHLGPVLFCRACATLFWQPVDKKLCLSLRALRWSHTEPYD